MKTRIIFFISILVLIMVVSCANPEHEAVKGFAKKFERAMKDNDIETLREMYPNKDVSNPALFTFYDSEPEIFPLEPNKYKVKYGSLGHIIVRVGLDNAMEIEDSEGMFDVVYEVTESPTAEPASYDETEEDTSDSESKKQFVAEFKKNIKADKQWKDAGWHDNDNYGDCYIYINNRNNFPVDASDYYITFKYEYLYEGGATIHSEKVRQEGKYLSSNGKAKFTHYYTDDCGPLDVKVNFKLSDDQIFDKYGNR